MVIKAFANSDYDLEVVKAVLTDDDIDVVQQYAIWYFTNGDTDKYNVETLPAVTLDNYLDANLTFQKEGGSYQDVMGESYHRQEIANYLYQYLIKSAKEAKEDETVTYPSIQDTTRTAELKDDYYIVGPFHVNSGTATSTEYAITLLDQNENEIARENYRILKEGEEEFTTDNVNEIFDTDYYIYLPVTQENITSVSLNVSYTSFDTRASLWKNNTTNEENVEIYQPLTLVTREKTPHTQRAVVSIDRKTADLALRKYIVKVNDTQLNREPTVDVTNLKNGTSQTATYKHAKDPIEVSTGDTIIYEIRVYNEADVDGIATTIYDALPAGLLLVDPSESTINSTYGWEIDTEGTNRNVYKTEYLKDTVIPAFDKENDTELHSAYVQIECKIADDANPASVLTNIAEIGEDNITDRDSTEKNNDYVENDLDSKNYTGDKDNKSDLTDETYFYQGVEDDDDFEKVVIAGKAFDLSLQKFISRVNKNAPSPSREPKVDVSKLKDGTSTDATYTTTKTPVTVKKGDVVIYTIRVYNEGDLAGYAEEVSDYLPEGLGYLVNHTVNVDNYWAIPEDCNTVKLTTIDDSKNNLSADDFNGVTSLDEVEVAVGKVKLTSTKFK